MIAAVLIAAVLLLAGVLALYLRHDPARRGPDPDAGLIVNAACDYDVTQAFLPVTRYDGAPWEDALPPPNVPGRDAPETPRAAATPAPPGWPDGQRQPEGEPGIPAGGSSPPAGDTLAPGSEPSGAPGREPEPLPPDLANWHLAMWHAAAAQAKIRQALTGNDGTP